MKLINDNVLVEPVVEKEKNTFGIVLPESAQSPIAKGRVVEASAQYETNGVFVSMLVVKGQVVIYPRLSGELIELDGKKYVLLRQREILGIVE